MFVADQGKRSFGVNISVTVHFTFSTPSQGRLGVDGGPKLRRRRMGSPPTPGPSLRGKENRIAVTARFVCHIRDPDDNKLSAVYEGEVS